MYAHNGSEEINLEQNTDIFYLSCFACFRMVMVYNNNNTLSSRRYTRWSNPTLMTIITMTRMLTMATTMMTLTLVQLMVTMTIE
jgi:hypothetical protein